MRSRTRIELARPQINAIEIPTLNHYIVGMRTARAHMGREKWHSLRRLYVRAGARFGGEKNVAIGHAGATHGSRPEVEKNDQLALRFVRVIKFR